MRAFELQRHITVRHTNEKKFVCDVCGQKFALKLYLNNHVRNKHQPDTEKPFACPHCNYRVCTNKLSTIGGLCQLTANLSHLSMFALKRFVLSAGLVLLIMSILGKFNVPNSIK